MQTLLKPIWLIGLFLSLCSGAAYPAPIYSVSLQVPVAQQPLLENHLDLYRWRDSERMDVVQLRRLVDEAPAQIRSFLETEGFFSPQVEVKLESSGTNWIVRISVQPGEPVKVAQVELNVHGPFDDGSTEHRKQLAELRAEWSLPPGAVFRQAAWEKAKRDALRDLLLTEYPAATIQASQATVNPETRSVSLTLTLDSGPAFSFGPLAITGLKRYPASVIEHLNPIRPGEPYSQAKLLEFQSRLQNTPYFASVNVHMESDPAHPSFAPVQVTVVERQSRTLGLGAGISTDTGPRAQLNYQDINWLDKAWHLSSNLKVADKEQSLDAKLQLPATRHGFKDSISAVIKRTDVEGLITQTMTLGGQRSRLQGRNEITYGLHYYGGHQEIDGVAGSKQSALVPSWALTQRAVDNLLYPRRGYLLNLQADAANQALLSDRSFARGYVKATWFQPLGIDDQAILRGEFGGVAAKSRDGIPSDFLFRTGGDQTVRGYAYQSLGVREADAIVGGRWLAVVSAEYVHWLTPSWGTALFVDAGDAADQMHELHPVVGYGLGARWKSPVGMLALDVGHGQATGQTRLHFALGFSF